MKTLVLAIVAVALLVITDPAEAVLKCPQRDASVVSVPESVGCSTEFDRARQRAEQEASSQRRQAERAAEVRQPLPGRMAPCVCSARPNIGSTTRPAWSARASPELQVDQ